MGKSPFSLFLWEKKKREKKVKNWIPYCEMWVNGYVCVSEEVSSFSFGGSNFKTLESREELDN